MKILKAFIQEYDDFYFIHAHPNIKYFTLAKFVRAKNKIGPAGRWGDRFYTEVREIKNLHKIDYYTSFVSNGEKIKFPPFSLKTFKKNIILYAPGSGETEKHKRWADIKVSNLIGLLRKEYPDFTHLLIGAKSEVNLLKEIASKTESPKIELKLLNSIEESFNIIREASLIITVCNGTSHIADFLQTPRLTLYGPTNPSHTGIYGKETTVIRKDYNCSPCYRENFIKGCGNPICMEDISVEEVFEKAILAINGRYFPQHEFISNKFSVKPSH